MFPDKFFDIEPTILPSSCSYVPVTWPVVCIRCIVLKSVFHVPVQLRFGGLLGAALTVTATVEVRAPIALAAVKV